MKTKAKVLFVDDEERIVNLLRIMFRANFEVFTATSGDAALKIIDAHDIQVVVSDQRMPGMTGIELLSAVRQRSPATMRILLTGYSDLAAIVGSVNDGEVFRFANKPWNNEEIKATVAEAADIALASAEVTPSQFETVPSMFNAVAAPALLVLDDSDTDRRQIMHLFAADYRVFGASNVAEALKVIEQQDIGVIVSEARVGSEDTGQLLRILKKNFPLITTVMLTSSADSDLVIKMINQAQIFRFAMKPIRAGVFQLAVSAAMKEHRRFRADPRLVARHRVAKAIEPENTSLAASVIASLSRLRSRFSFFSRKAA
ncbi:response regulator [Ideonella sp. A 288]|uniref:response regulator n=1 Tax=Ideonella sp. A 288 TaxID=1962181 RepID=UPI000B4C0D14|nr:response regulator [Ideonella sp. A 288]